MSQTGSQTPPTPSRELPADYGDERARMVWRVVGAPLLRRRRANPNSYNLGLVLFGLVFLVGIPGGWLYMLDQATRQPSRMSQTVTAVWGSRPTPTLPAPPRLDWRPASTPAATRPWAPSPTPRRPAAVTPTATPTPEDRGEVARYSYYYPPLGGPNCHPAHWLGHTCADTTASGLPWSQWLGRGVAVPPSRWLEWRGCSLVVRSPAEIRGSYLVLDVCPACDPPDGGPIYLDFLSARQALPWRAEIRFWVDCSTPKGWR